jgi:cytochrome c biogenesis protein CcmG/thiol:disulfide interchange protein DsbE
LPVVDTAAGGLRRRQGAGQAQHRRHRAGLRDDPRRRHARAIPAAWAGKPLVIRFWADWCKYCEGEMKDIEKVYQRLKPRGLDVIAINAGQDRKTVTEFMKKLGVSYPALMDENSAIAKRYGVVGLPTTYFVDAKGVVRAKLIGEADEASFERAALEALK